MNNKLHNAIIEFYQHKIESYQLAEVYFEENLYSAAATYYTLQLNELCNCNKDRYEFKSYCFSKLAECYYHQQKDKLFSDWQLSLIHDMCKESIVYDRFNILSYLFLSKCYIGRKDPKNAYFTLNQLFMNLSLYNKLDKNYYDLFIESVIDYFDICEIYQIIKYDELYKSIINYLLKFNFPSKDIITVTNRYQKHINKITEYEHDIINGNISKYY